MGLLRGKTRALHVSTRTYSVLTAKYVACILPKTKNQIVSFLLLQYKLLLPLIAVRVSFSLTEKQMVAFLLQQ